MSLPLSPHHPLYAGRIETVTGSLEIETGLRDIQAAHVSLMAVPSANAAFLAWSFRIDEGGHALLTINVYKANYDLSVTATKVSWTALGK